MCNGSDLLSLGRLPFRGFWPVQCGSTDRFFHGPNVIRWMPSLWAGAGTWDHLRLRLELCLQVGYAHVDALVGLPLVDCPSGGHFRGSQSDGEFRVSRVREVPVLRQHCPVDHRPWAPRCFQPCQDGHHGASLTLHHSSHGAAIGVHDPPNNAELVRILLGVISKVYSLHLAKYFKLSAQVALLLFYREVQPPATHPATRTPVTLAFSELA
mmetsp:Transcript_19093/g.48173  ORF Transcript_19093/g.48173 Transcript_19093/m.48173 type:complete len:211 (+) Transcript_19093:211-843(+)